ncbi:hypothetical protein BH11PLA2_BH11PLA2_20850 [soil metagenome]
MCSMISRCRLFAMAIIVPGMIAGFGVLAAQAPQAEKAEPKKAAANEKHERGKFVAFKDGILSINANSGATLENKIPENTKVSVWNDTESTFKPVATAEALAQAKPGTWMVVSVSNQNVSIRIGAKKRQTTGTFVSFKDERLLMLGKNLGESFTKKYGNNVHFNKFRKDVPVYESIDGGEYKLVEGTPGKILPNVKEGTLVTVHGEGDDNITLIQVGEHKAK